MPFKSEKQRRFLYAKHPEIAKRWSEEEKQGNLGRKKMKPGTVARVKARMAADRKKEEAERKRLAERAKVDAHIRNGLAQRAAARKSPTPKTPAQIRSEVAAARRKGWMPAGLRKLYEALGGK